MDTQKPCNYGDGWFCFAAKQQGLGGWRMAEPKRGYRHIILVSPITYSLVRPTVRGTTHEAAGNSG